MSNGVDVKAKRIQLGLTQQELADQSGVSLRTIQRIENQGARPSLFTLKALAKVLDMDVQSLVNDSATPTHTYHFHLQINLTGMRSFLLDLQSFAKTHWKILASIALMIWFIAYYPDIKSGFWDGWNQK
jgi:transcriptional regulator with XRE-family HTH domain